MEYIIREIWIPGLSKINFEKTPHGYFYQTKRFSRMVNEMSTSENPKRINSVATDKTFACCQYFRVSKYFSRSVRNNPADPVFLSLVITPHPSCDRIPLDSTPRRNP